MVLELLTVVGTAGIFIVGLNGNLLDLNLVRNLYLICDVGRALTVDLLVCGRLLAILRMDCGLMNGYCCVRLLDLYLLVLKLRKKL